MNRADERPPDRPLDRIPKPLQVLDTIAAFGIAHIERLADGIRYRHAMQTIPPGELDYHQNEHCLCGPVIERLPCAVEGAHWVVRHYEVLDYEDAEHKD
jgi:hypothetical protein